MAQLPRTRRRKRRLLLLGLVLLLPPLALYLLREPLLGRPLARLAGRLLSRELGAPVSIDRISGNWFTTLSASGLRSDPADSEDRPLRIDLENLHLRYSLVELLLGRDRWLKEVTAEGKRLELDLDRLGRPPGPPRRPRPLEPRPPRVLLLDPAARIRLDHLVLATGTDQIRFTGLLVELEPGGSLRASASHAASTFLPGEEGALTLECRRADFRFSEIALRLGRISLDRGLVELAQSPRRIPIRGHLVHPWGELEAELELSPSALGFDLLAERLRADPLLSLLGDPFPGAEAARGTLTASGLLPFAEPKSVEARWSLWIDWPGGLLERARLAGRAGGGRMHLEPSRLEAPGLAAMLTGLLSMEGQWEAAVEIQVDGDAELRALPGLGTTRCRGRIEATASGGFTGPPTASALLELDQLRAAGLPDISALRARLAWNPAGRLVLESASARLAGGTLAAAAELRTGSVPMAWNGRLELEGLDLSRLDPGLVGRLHALSLLAEGSGTSGSADLVAAFGRAIASPEAVIACQGGFELGPALRLAPRRLSGQLLEWPLELLEPATLELAAGTLDCSRIRLSLGSSLISAQGVYPPSDEEEAFELRALLEPGELSALLPPALRSGLTQVGLGGSPLSLALDLASQEIHLRLDGGSGRSLDLDARPLGREATRFSLESALGEPARRLRIEARLPWPSRRFVRGAIPRDLETLEGIGLFLAFEGLRPGLLPGVPLLGEVDGTLLLDGEARALRLGLSSAELTPSQGPEELLRPWEAGLEATWTLEGLAIRCLGNTGPNGPSFELDLSTDLDFPTRGAFDPEALAEGLLERLWKLHLGADRLPAALLLPGLEPAPSGEWSATVRIEGSLAHPRGRMEASADALSWSPPRDGAPLAALERLTLIGALEGDRLQARLSGRLESGGRIEAQGSAPVRLSALVQGGAFLPPGGGLEALLELESFGLQNLGGLSEELLELSGTLHGQARLAGTWASPEPSGRLEIREGFVKTRSALPALGEIQGALQIRPDAIELEGITAEGAGGTVRLSGRVADPFGHPRFDLALEGKEALLAREGGLRVRADLELRLEGDLERARLSGSVDLTDGRFRRHLPLLALGLEAAGRAAEEVPALFESGGLSSLPGPASGRPPFSLSGPLGERLELALTLRAVRPPFQVLTNFLRGPFQARLHLRGTGENPWLEGDITAAEGGFLGLPGLNLRIRALRLAFDPSDPYRPRLYLVALGRKQSIDVQLVAQGPLDDLFVDITSIPPYPKEDLILFLTTGSLPRDLSGGRAALGVLGAYVGAELMEYLAGGDDGGEENGWFQERVTVEVGTEVSREGKESIRGELHLREISDKLYLQAERDTLAAYNLGLLFRWRWH